MLGIALVGLIANGVSLFILRDAQRQTLNMRGAYLEVMGDFGGSAAVIVAALVISLTGRVQADPVASAVIGFLILPRTWRLLRDALDILLEATPKVVDIHDLHAWTIRSGMNVVSAHVVIDGSADPPAVLDQLGRCLSGDFDIEHSTFQLETQDRRRLEERHHA